MGEMKKILLSDLWQLRMKYLWELSEDKNRLELDEEALRRLGVVTDSFIRWIFAELGE